MFGFVLRINFSSIIIGLNYILRRLNCFLVISDVLLYSVAAKQQQFFFIIFFFLNFKLERIHFNGILHVLDMHRHRICDIIAHLQYLDGRVCMCCAIWVEYISTRLTLNIICHTVTTKQLVVIRIQSNWQKRAQVLN